MPGEERRKCPPKKLYFLFYPVGENSSPSVKKEKGNRKMETKKEGNWYFTVLCSLHFSISIQYSQAQRPDKRTQKKEGSKELFLLRLFETPHLLWYCVEQMEIALHNPLSLCSTSCKTSGTSFHCTSSAAKLSYLDLFVVLSSLLNSRTQLAGFCRF